MDFAYLAKVTKLNVAALAAIASAPPPPETKVLGAVQTDTSVAWDPVMGATSYLVRWRRTDANRWEVSQRVDAREGSCPVDRDVASETRLSCAVKLPHIRVDDWVFGVSSVSKDGFESPVASAVPGGGYRPRWYRGSQFSGARLSDLGHALGASYATAATPKSSSSGGGSRGGGSSGGGRGGGGGGGW